MDRGTVSARLVRVIAALLAVVGTMLACGGIAMFVWLRGNSEATNATSVLLGVGIVAVTIGLGQVVLGSVLMTWVKRYRAFERARRREVARSSGRNEKADVPVWARRTPPSQRSDDGPMETTDTWALLDAMRAELAAEHAANQSDRHSD